MRLFNRLPEGVVLTEEGKSILVDARAMEVASFNVRRQGLIDKENLKGVVRVSITEGLGVYWVLPRLVAFQQANRLLTVEMQCTMASTDVGRLEADISIQYSRPERPDLITARLGYLHVYPFASREYERQFGLPRDTSEIAQHRIIQQIAPQLDENEYARQLGLTSVAGIVGIRTNASSAVLYAVERGAGIGFLPSYALALGAKLVPVDMGIRPRLEIWMTYHPNTRESRRHMIVVDWLKRVFDARRFPCFGEAFIHPYDLAPRMADATVVNNIENYLTGHGALGGEIIGDPPARLPK